MTTEVGAGARRARARTTTIRTLTLTRTTAGSSSPGGAPPQASRGRGRPVKKEGDEAAGGEVSVSAQHKQKQANGKGKAQPKRKSSGSGEKAKARGERRKAKGERAKRRKHTGSAAEALRVVTELAKVSSAVAGPAPAAAAAASEAQQAPQDTLKAEDEGEMTLVKSEGEAAVGYFGGSAGAVEGGLPIARAVYESPQGQAPFGYPAASASSSSYTPTYAGYSSTPGPGPSYASMAPYTPLPPTSGYTNTNANASGMPGRPYYDDALRARKNSAIPLPVPVPNLIKKSRGRHVPAVALPAANAFSPTPVPSSSAGASSSSSGGGLGRTGSAGSVGSGGAERLFVCAVEGCGKCFVRGEHLKRHVRSIHTHDKRERLFLPATKQNLKLTTFLVGQRTGAPTTGAGRRSAGGTTWRSIRGCICLRSPFVALRVPSSPNHCCVHPTRRRRQ
jgi:hypothetical protein